MRGIFTILVLLLSLAGARANEDENARIRAELDADLEREIKISRPSVEIRFDGMDSDHYDIVGADFSLDGRTLPYSPQKDTGIQDEILYFGIVSPGSHEVIALISVQAKARFFSTETGTKFKVPGHWTLNAQSGLVLSFHIRLEVDESAPIDRRMKLIASADPLVVAPFKGTHDTASAAKGPDSARGGPKPGNPSIQGVKSVESSRRVEALSEPPISPARPTRIAHGAHKHKRGTRGMEAPPGEKAASSEEGDPVATMKISDHALKEALRQAVEASGPGG